MIRSVWTFIQDVPCASNSSRAQRSVTRAAVLPATEATDEVAERLVHEAAEDLATQPTKSGSCVFVAGEAAREDAYSAGSSAVTEVRSLRHGQPFDIAIGVTGAATHIIRIPNAPLPGEAIVAVRVCAELDFPDVMDLGAP